jgi:hypothetical protein
MAAKKNILSFIRLGLVNPYLMQLAWKLKKTKRTYLSYSTLYSLVENFIDINNHISHPLQVAEFGVGRGGSATILAWLVNRFEGNLTLFDIFGRIPAPSQQDGVEALSRYDYIVNQEKKDYYGNISDLLDIILADLYKVCKPERIDVVKGKYEDVLPSLNDEREFNLVHIDCDWYESSKVVYDYIQTRLQNGAIIQVDDYSTWEGSMRAFQETTWLSTCPTHLVDGALVINTY